MLKLLKWDFFNFIKKYYWFYIGFAAVFTITAILPENIWFLSAVVDGVSVVYSMIYFVGALAISAAEIIDWLRRESAQLELSLPQKPWEILLSKLMLSICINAAGLIFTLLLWSQIRSFGMSKIMLINDFTGFLQYLVCMLILLVIVMFSYISAKSFKFTRNKAAVTSALLSVSIYLLLICAALIFFITTGAWKVTIVNVGEYQGGFSISADGKLKWLEAIGYAAGGIMIIAAGFFTSCKLFKHRFERY